MLPCSNSAWTETDLIWRHMALYHTEKGASASTRVSYFHHCHQLVTTAESFDQDVNADCNLSY